MAVFNGRLVIAITMLNKLVVADVGRKKVIAELTIPSPKSPVFDSAGQLLLISEGQVKRFTLPEDQPALTNEAILIAGGLEDPARLSLDPQGNLLVSDWGRSHQVKVFDPEGKWLRTLGRSGGPQTGLYDENGMAHPGGAAVDDRGRVWVAEGDQPKRVSLWQTNGAFVKAFYGPMKYGGGGSIDPVDKSRFYYEEAGCGIEFALDWLAGSSAVKAVYWRPELMTPYEVMPSGLPPERAFVAGGFRYLVNSYNGGLRENQDRGIGVWRMDPDHIARPVALIGNGADLVNGLWGWKMKNREAITQLWAGRKPEQVLFVWSDRNDDHVAQPDEIQWVAEDHSAASNSWIGGIGIEALVAEDLSFTTAFGTRVPAPRIDSLGRLTYDLKQRTVVGDAAEMRPPLLAGDRALVHRDPRNVWGGYDLAGGKRWWYPVTPEEETGGPGAMVAPTRLLGPAVVPSSGQAGPLVAINGEMGAVFLVTMDGLFIQTLGGDARLLPPLSEPNPRRDAVFDGISFQQEHFHPTINQTADGKLYLVAGFQQGSIFRLEGLDTIQRRDFGRLTLSPEQLAGIPETSSQSARKNGRPRQSIAIRPNPPRLEGDFSDWPSDAWMRIDEQASAAVAVDTNTLYAAFRVQDPRALDNAGRDYRYLFKTGGALDLMLRTAPGGPEGRRGPVAGDVRLLVTRLGGKTAAVLYRPVSPKAATADRVVFESPVGKVEFDEVTPVGEAVKLMEKPGGFIVCVPLATLGLQPSPGMELLGDVGVLRGHEGRTMRRVYWSNRNTALVSDLPSEARLQPAEWGVWKLADPR